MHLDADATYDALGRAFLTAMRALGSDAVGGELPGLYYGGAGTPVPGFNRLIAIRMDPSRADRDIDAALAALASLPVLSAWLPDGADQADLEKRFAARGFSSPEGTVPAMTRPLAGLPALDPAPGVIVTMARTDAEVLATAPALAAGFGAPVAVMEMVLGRIARIVGAPGSTARVVSVHDGTAVVSTGYSVVAGDAVAIYNVATLPEARGRGFAKLASLALLHEGMELGARHAVLESTEAGHPVYLRLGFQDVGSYRVMLRSS